MAIAAPAVGDKATAAWADAVALAINTGHGARVTTNAVQAVAAITTTALNNGGAAAWTATEDTDGYFSGVGGTSTPIIVPAALAGLYAIGVKYTQSAASTARLLAIVRVNGTEVGRLSNYNDSIVGGCIFQRLAVGDQISVASFTSTAANVSVGTQIYAYQVGS